MKSYLSVVSIVVVLVLIGLAVLYRAPLMALFGSRTQEQIATTTQETLPVWQAYASTTMGVALEYPPGYTLDELYFYGQFPGKPIHGVSFVVPASVATGTNLSADTRLSVEQLPRAKSCTGDIYINDNVKATKMTENGVEYSVASTTGAGAGNRYEEWVYAIVGSQPCTAVRYYLHSTNIGNYPAGAVREYDRGQLLAEFDQIRRSLRTGATDTTPAATTTTQ